MSDQMNNDGQQTEQKSETKSNGYVGYKPVPLAIVGIGCLFPKAKDAQSYWANIKGGVDGITEIPDTHWDPKDYFDENKKAPDMTYAHRGGFLEPLQFNPLHFGITPNNIEATDTTQLLGMVAAEQALLDAGYETSGGVGDGRAFDRDRTSVILGVTGTLELVIPLGARLGSPIWKKAMRDAGLDEATTADVVERIKEGYVPWQENSFPGLLGNVAAGRIANRFDLGGTNCVVDAACASSLGAVHMAAMELYSGKSDMAITGGLDTFNDIFMYMCFSKTPALSATGNSKPFSKDGDGTILGEGLGVVVLKRLEDAERDGDHIVAVIKSVGSSSDGKGNAVYAPSSKGQVKAIKDAYRLAEVEPSSIELVEAHGTGTKVGDGVEVTALTEVYSAGRGDRKGSWCGVGSVKSMIGHTKSSAGVAGLIKAAMALQNKVLPPSIKVEQPLEMMTAEDSPLYFSGEARPWVGGGETPRRAALSAFGFGGSNFHAVLEEGSRKKLKADWSGDALVLPFEADSFSGLNAAVQGFSATADFQDAKLGWENLREAAGKQRDELSGNAAYRLSLVVEKNGKALADVLGQAVKGMQKHGDVKQWSQGKVFYGKGEKAGKLAGMFPGQGSQRVGMLKDLSLLFPEMLDSLESGNAVYTGFGYEGRLSDVIYPVTRFEDAVRKLDEMVLKETQNAQPSLGVVSMGAHKVLSGFGVSLDAAGGHSYGELVGLCVGGVYDEQSLYTLSNARGGLMSEFSKQGGGASGMLAVLTDIETVKRVLIDEGINLVVANHNSHEQVVLSGANVELDKAEVAFKNIVVTCKRLDVSAGFHSEYVSGACEPFGVVIGGLDFTESKIDVYSNTRGKVYVKDIVGVKSCLGEQLGQGVMFVDQVEQMYADGVRIFVEIGPGKTLAGLIGRILKGKDDVTIVGVEGSAGRGDGVADLGSCLAQLWAAGCDVDLSQWDKGYPVKPADDGKKKMMVELSGANYVMKRECKKSAEKKVVVSQATAVGGDMKNVAVNEAAQGGAVGGVQMDGIREVKKQPAVSNAVVNQPIEKAVTSVTNPNISSVPQGQAPAVNPNQLHTALAATQQGIAAIAQMQQHTAQLHQQYLQGQQATAQMMQNLMSMQQNLIAGGVVQVVTPVTMPVSAPVAPFAPVAARPVVAAPVYQPVPVVAAPVAKPVVAPVSAPIPAEVHGSSGGGSSSKTTEVLLEVVAEKTGYSVDMLELDMNLDSDLGIDSIKRVEIMSGVSERLPELREVSSEDMGSLQTLGEIVDYLGDGGAAEVGPVASGGDASETTAVLLEVVAEKTGYSVDMLELDMNLDSDLGIDSIKRVEIMSGVSERLPSLREVSSEDMGSLQTLGEIVEYLGGGCVEVAMDANEEGGISRLVVKKFDLAGRSVKKSELGGEIWVTGADAELAGVLVSELEKRGVVGRVVGLDMQVSKADQVGGLVVLPSVGVDERFIYDAFGLIQRVLPRLEACGGSLVSVSHLGGSFGVGDDLRGEPLSGSLAGIVKTASYEYAGVKCKAVDVGYGFNGVVDRAVALADELFIDGPLEVGIDVGGVRSTLILDDQGRVIPRRNGKVLDQKDVVLVTGGARGVTAEVVYEMGREYGCQFVLIGRSAEPVAEDAWLTALTDEKDIKQGIVKHLGEKHPRKVGELFKKVMANREVLGNLKRISDLGCKVIYRSADVRDADTLSAIANEARNTMGRIAGVVHGAGVLMDRFIADKTAEQFAAVYETKVLGLKAMLKATEGDDLRAMVMFASSTGRFGRKGQVDYAAANEALNKMAQAERIARPSCRVVSVNWGPWDGGMVTAELRKVFEAEGVGVIPMTAGARYLANEIGGELDGPVEVVILGECDVDRLGGNDIGEVVTGKAETVEVAIERVPAAGVVKAGTGHVVFERRVDVSSHPFLRSHVINGHAVLPMAVMGEWLAHAGMSEYPGFVFGGFEGLRVFKGVILERGGGIDLQVKVGELVKVEDGFEVVAELVSGKVLHARANLLLVNEVLEAGESDGIGRMDDYGFDAAGVYVEKKLFHGQAMQGVERIEGVTDEMICVVSKGAPKPGEWMRNPLRSGWITDPLVIDVAFQAMILWCQRKFGCGSLPTCVGRYRQFVESYHGGEILVVGYVEEAGSNSVKARFEFLDDQGDMVGQITGYECVVDQSLNAAFEKNNLLEEVGA